MFNPPGTLERHLKPLLAPASEAPQAGDIRAAAVLLPLYRQQGEWWLLFTRRTESVEHHRGQVSFPGGMVEEGDAHFAMTALREAEEEIGLRQDAVQVLGQMDPIVTSSGFRVTPVVGVLPWPTWFHLNAHEVARVFGIPIDWLADGHNHSSRQVALPGASDPLQVVTFLPFDGEVVWGATARIVVDFLHLLGGSGKQAPGEAAGPRPV